MEDEPRYVAFAGARLLVEGSALAVLPVLKHRFEKDPLDSVLVFEAASGRQIDFDLSVPLDALLAQASGDTPRGPGRPRLGVTSREISLLPRHWEWLERQPNGISAAIRRLVEQAMKQNPGRERARRIRASLSHMLTALAGDRPHYEEATRALFADDVPRFERLVARWPRDLREYAIRRVREAHDAEQSDDATGGGGAP